MQSTRAFHGSSASLVMCWRQLSSTQLWRSSPARPEQYCDRQPSNISQGVPKSQALSCAQHLSWRQSVHSAVVEMSLVTSHKGSPVPPAPALPPEPSPPPRPPPPWPLDELPDFPDAPPEPVFNVPPLPDVPPPPAAGSIRPSPKSGSSGKHAGASARSAARGACRRVVNTATTEPQ